MNDSRQQRGTNRRRRDFPWSDSSFGPWTIGYYISSGGNAAVYQARHPDGRRGALKVLKPDFQAPNREPFKRFRNEVRINAEIGAHNGIMPIWQSNVPDLPTERDPAWFVMPLATSLRRHLGEGPALDHVIKAIEAVAATLADLAERGIYHRDIKPENLFVLDDTSVIGDFGLVHSAESESLTRIGRAFGSRHYYAPEMRNPTETTDYSRADVYSLAKTLWVIATDQNSPPEGELRLDTRQLLVSSWVQDEKATAIDRLIARSTTYESAMRPSMDEFRGELRALLRSPTERPEVPNLRSLAEEVAALTAPAHREQREREERLQAGRQLLAHVQSQLNELGKQAADMGFEVANGPNYAGHNSTVADYIPSDPIQELHWRDGTAIVTVSPGFQPVMLWSGFGFHLSLDGYLTVIAAHLIRDNKTMGPQATPDIIWQARRRDVVASESSKHAAEELLVELTDTLANALVEYKRRLT